MNPGLLHLQGRHAPGIADLGTATAVSHHLLLSHAQAVEAYRASRYGKQGKIGIVLNLYPCVPSTETDADVTAAHLADGFQNRWFLDPLYKGTYPEDILERFTSVNAAPPVRNGDLLYIASQKTDFLGINYYFRKVLRAATEKEVTSGAVPHSVLPFTETKPEGAPYTATGWEVWPEGLKDLLVRIKNDYGNPVMQITENGAAFPDSERQEDPKLGTVIVDDDRRKFIEQHIASLHEALEAGCHVTAYYVWSLLDNFEWAQGYSKRFGLFRTEYGTEQRLWKKSGVWYRDFLHN